MRSKTSNWYEVKFSYDKTMEGGQVKKVTELYVVEALSFSEAEKRIIEEMACYVQAEYDIKAIAIPQYKEVWFSDNAAEDKWYKAKLLFVTIDEKTEKEKKSNIFYLVQAGSFDAAKKYVEQMMGGTMLDYTIVSIKETAILDLFEKK